MKFKIGDKVKHKHLGVGEIIGFDEYDNQYAVEYWCWDDEIELVEEVPKNLIPQVAKMLGVEIGEEFEIDGISNIVCKFTDLYLLSRDKRDKREEAQWYVVFVELSYLLSGEWHIKKLFNKPILTEDEKAILRNIPKEYKYIARDSSGLLYIYENKPKKDGNVWSNYNYNCLDLFQHLFQFVKCEDENPYKIQELLEEYENLRSE